MLVVVLVLGHQCMKTLLESKTWKVVVGGGGDEGIGRMGL